MNAPDDLDRLLPAIVAGDTEAFAVFMSAVELTVRRSLRTFATRVDVEALVQEAFLRLWQVAPRFRADGRPHGLLRLALRIGRNLAIDEVRRRKEDTAADGEVEVAEPPHAAALDPLLRKLILGCFEQLPPRPGDAMRERLCNEGSEPDADLARRCGMTLNTFLQNVTRARKLLASCLEGQGVDLSEPGSQTWAP